MNSNQPIHNQKHNNFNLQDFVRKHRTLSLIIAISAISLISIFFIWLYLRATKEPFIVVEEAPIPYLDHYYLIEYSTNPQTASDLQTQLGNVIVDQAEIDSAPSTNVSDLPNFYTATLSEESFQDSSTLTNTHIYTDITVSDSRTYKLTFYSDYLQQSYIVVVLDRTDNPDIADHAFIYSADQSAEEFAIDWVDSLNLTTPIISTSSLY